MIELTQTAERVLVVGVQTDTYHDDKFQMLMAEMDALVDTAGGQVIAQVKQNLPQLDRRTAVGSGKLMEIQQIVADKTIDLVIFLNELSPSMNRNIEASLQVRVIDRVQLILDIFAMRARSKVGKLQVAQAQYDYLLPRIQGQGKYLSRQGGGIGTRGPGETKLESDRRHIRTIMRHIQNELNISAAHRERNRIRRRQGLAFNIGLIGYTNAGKSTLLTALTQRETYIQDQLFATLDPLTRQMSINGHDIFTLTDTVGFIEELPTQLIHAFKSTLEEMKEVDLLLHVIDGSNPIHYLHEQTVNQLLIELDMNHIPILKLYNKADQLPNPLQADQFDALSISARNSSDIVKLKQHIWQQMLQQLAYYEQEIEPAQAEQLHQLQTYTLVTDIYFDENREIYCVKGYRRKEKE